MNRSASGLSRRAFRQGLLAASTLAAPAWVRAQGKGRELVVGGAGSHKAFLDPLIPVFEKQTGCKVIFEARARS